MSYILSALKKAEQQRNRDNTGDLQKLVAGDWDPYKREVSVAPAVWLLIIVVLLSVAALSGYVLLSRETSSTTSENGAAQVLSPVQETVAEKSKAEASPQAAEVAQPDAAIAVPTLKIAGHVFVSEGSRMNRVFTSEGSLQTGDWIDKNWQVVEVRDDGLKIRHNTRQEFITFR